MGDSNIPAITAGLYMKRGLTILIMIGNINRSSEEMR